MPLPKTQDAEALLAFLRASLKASGKSQLEVAKELGVKPSMMSQVFTGVTAVPLLRVKPLAVALRLEPKTLLRAVMKVHEPEMDDLIFDKDRAAARASISEFEMNIISVFRSATAGMTRRLTNAELSGVGEAVSKSLRNIPGGRCLN